MQVLADATLGTTQSVADVQGLARTQELSHASPWANSVQLRNQRAPQPTLVRSRPRAGASLSAGSAGDRSSDSSTITGCPTGALRSDHVHEAAYTALLPYRDGRWWDGSHFAVPKSPLGHNVTPVFLQVGARGVLLSGLLRPS